MYYPVLFSAVRSIRLRDPLAELLGVAEGGIKERLWLDAVRLERILMDDADDPALPILHEERRA